jgi:hypothetical protein
LADAIEAENDPIETAAAGFGATIDIAFLTSVFSVAGFPVRHEPIVPA